MLRRVLESAVSFQTVHETSLKAEKFEYDFTFHFETRLETDNKLLTVVRFRIVLFKFRRGRRKALCIIICICCPHDGGRGGEVRNGETHTKKGVRILTERPLEKSKIALSKFCISLCTCYQLKCSVHLKITSRTLEVMVPKITIRSNIVY